MSKQISEKQLMKQSTNEWDKSWGIWSKCWLAYLIIFFPEKAQEQDVLSQALIFRTVWQGRVFTLIALHVQSPEESR